MAADSAKPEKGVSMGSGQVHRSNEGDAAQLDKLRSAYRLGENHKVDIDLTDLGGLAENESPDIDIRLDDQIPDVDEIDLTFSSGRSLITRPSSEATIIRGRKKLDKTYKHTWESTDLSEKRLIYPEMDQYEILNAFREIRTEILRDAKQDNQVVMVVSLAYGMGSTFSAVNLAASFAFEGEKTALLVDCDQRRRQLSNVFEQEIAGGLSDYLCDSVISAEDIIYPTGIKRLRFIPIGARRPEIGEFFSSARMREFVIQIKRRYVDRFVILSAPPLEESIDAAILAEYCDQIVIVVPYGKVNADRLKKALRLLPRQKITGIVFNNRIKHV